jgi:ABC-type uncharacterized transport system involved in gliding motility auxiliary subunit
MTAEMSPGEITSGFHPANKEFTLALRLSGKFKTAFPDGAPKDPATGKKDDTAKPDTTGSAAAASPSPSPSPGPAPAPGLKESAKENTIILVGDTDMLQDQFAVEEQDNPLGGRVVVPFNGNLAFAENAVEQLTGDSNLISIRSRATRERPFTVVEKLEEAAEAKYQSKEKEIETSISDVVAKLSETQQHRADSDQKMILTPEQQAQVSKLKEELATKNKEKHQITRHATVPQHDEPQPIQHPFRRFAAPCGGECDCV